MKNQFIVRIWFETDSKTMPKFSVTYGKGGTVNYAESPFDTEEEARAFAKAKAQDAVTSRVVRVKIYQRKVTPWIELDSGEYFY